MISIIFNNIKIINLDKNYLIIHLLEKKGIKFNYQCRSGICGTCKCTLIKGKIQYQYDPLAFSNKKNKIFICIAKPLTSLHIKQ